MAGMKSIYISGPMTGVPNQNFPAFHFAAAALRARGYVVVNPAEINPDDGKSWHECLRADIKELCDCDAIALLPGWEGSAGAHLELHIAHRLGMEVTHVAELIGGDIPEIRVALPDMSASLPAQFQG